MISGALVIAAVITQVQHISDQRREGQVLLARLGKQTYQINALVWEYTANPSLVENSSSEVTALDAEIDRDLGQLFQISPHGSSLIPLRQDLSAYQDIRNQEFLLLEKGHPLQARLLNDEQVEPAFTTLSDDIETANIDFQAKAKLANTITASATTVVLVMSAILLFVIFYRFSRAQRYSLLLETEKETLHQSEQRFQALVRNASDVICILSPSCQIQYVSPASKRIWGQTPQELVGDSFYARIQEAEAGRFQTFVTQVSDEYEMGLTMEINLLYSDGGWRPTEALLTNFMHEPSINGLVLTCRDISERHAFEEQLAHQAFHDLLTSLPNRALFMERTRHALTRTKRSQSSISIVSLDLDNFKIINDSLGHEAGDLLLTTLAGRLTAYLRPEDTVARLGGDEFAILFEDVKDMDEVTQMTDRIAEVLRAPVTISGREVFTTGSLGITISTDENSTPEDLLRDADTAMYQAKISGKSRCVKFDAAMNARAVERLELESDLHQALANDEFRIVYQPIVSLEDGRLLEVEALVRWEHPRRGMISPIQFVPLAEENGLIVPLGLWVLREACRQAREWQMRDPQEPLLTVGVNLSSRQLQQCDLVDQITHVLHETGLPASSLKLEITESVMMQDTETTLAKLHQLKALGVSLAIDDFGTGYSSMSYLSTLPFDTLKIDRSFISKLGQQQEDTAIIKAIVTLAKTMALRITCEGIETWDQLVELHAMGCDLGQGYLFARPIRAEGMVPLLSHKWHVPVGLRILSMSNSPVRGILKAA